MSRTIPSPECPTLSILSKSRLQLMLFPAIWRSPKTRYDRSARCLDVGIRQMSGPDGTTKSFEITHLRLRNRPAKEFQKKTNGIRDRTAVAVLCMSRTTLLTPDVCVMCVEGISTKDKKLVFHTNCLAIFKIFLYSIWLIITSQNIFRYVCFQAVGP